VRKNIEAEKLLEVLCEKIRSGCPGICERCGVVKFIEDVRYQLGQMNNQELMRELNLEFDPTGCRCLKEHPNG